MSLKGLWFPDGIPLALGVSTGLSALAFFYALLGSAFQLWVDGVHIHHLYFGIAGLALSAGLWKAKRRWWALYLLGLSAVLVVDGFARIYLSFEGLPL